MGYQEYYQNCRPDTFKSSEALYARVVEAVLNPEYKVFEFGKPLTFMLGGFYPFSETPNAFLSFCKRIHPNNKDKHVFLDMNWTPVISLPASRFPFRVQANLKHIPFKKDSVDFIFLDSTLNFMDDETVKQFGTSVSEALSPNGLILVSMRIPKLFENLFSRLDNHVPIFVRDTNSLQKLLPDLKMVTWAERGKYELRVFSSLNADEKIYPPHEGESFLWDDEMKDEEVLRQLIA